MHSKETIDNLTLEEKASLCSGHDMWHTKAIERVGIPSIALSDGPHGLRKQAAEGDFLGIGMSLLSTCFPPACTTANSWNPDLLRHIGAALGEECLQEQVSVLLGPGLNIKRNPLCGRNFEYFSEDPLLAGELAAAFIEGLQAQGIGASIKHFAANNQETRRMTINALVDERALREIYLPGFEKAIKQMHPWTVMCAYNQLNGAYCSENIPLLTGLLRDEWGFEGVLLTDWGACNDRVRGLLAGQDLEMPGGLDDNKQRLIEAVRTGTLDEAVLDRTVARLLALIGRAQENKRPDYRYDVNEHHLLAYQAATQSAVLLKNEDDLLPLHTSGKLAVIGSLAKKIRYQGNGSSLINPTRLEHPWDILTERGIPMLYAEGYSLQTDTVNEKLIAAACQIAREAEIAVVFLGLTDLAESEGFDRDHMHLPDNQNVLIERLTSVQKNIVVVLFGGAPVEIPWINKVQSILHMYLPGQAGGSAVVDLLFGNANPCGKLAETYPLHYADTASARYFPGSSHTVEYRESIYVGYRYFDTVHQAVLFPFGHGLSYTQFTYEQMTLSTHTFTDRDTLQVNVTVTNTGPCAGEEIVQLYVHDVVSSVFKAEKELKAFQKVALLPGEQRTIMLTLSKRDFAYYDLAPADWVVESGEYTILVGASSRDIRFQETVTVQSTYQGKISPTPEALADYMHLEANRGKITDEAFNTLVYGKAYPAILNESKRLYTVNSTLDDLKRTLIGKIMYSVLISMAMKFTVDADPERQRLARNMIRRVMPEIPLRGLVASSGGVLTHGMMEGLALMANGQIFKGCRILFRSLPPKKQPIHAKPEQQ
jgi:beta-glucosidase